MNPMSNPAGHRASTLPWFLAGRAGGRIKPGRFVRLGDWKQSVRDGSSQVDHNCLLLTMANALLDQPLATWGDLSLPSYTDDPTRIRSPGTSLPDPRYRGELTELYA
jgi:hypothetical protein